LIKPSGADCNLRCDYCFYLEKAALYPDAARHRMSETVLAGLVRNYLAGQQPVHSFCWQGGEPTLLGPPFFRQVTRLQEEHARPGSVIANSVQTNAVFVDDALAAHFADYRFLVGVSLDGSAEIHDRHRMGVEGRGTHARVLCGIEKLRRRGVEVNILTVVTRTNVGRAADLYRYLRSLGFAHLQFIPCVMDRADRGAPFAIITGAEWGTFLNELFDTWWLHDVSRVSIRLFDAVAATLAYGRGSICTMADSCCQYLVVEHNGDIYPCDFYVEPERRLGNVLDDGLHEISRGRAYRQWGTQKVALPEECRRCTFMALCQGDCPRNRLDGRPSSLCDGWRAFFAHTVPRFAGLAQLALARDEATGVSRGAPVGETARESGSS